MTGNSPAGMAHSNRPIDFSSALRVLIKGVSLFIILNLLFGAIQPQAVLGRISGYNLLFPGRVRLPYGDVPARAYNLSLFNLGAMFASHEIASGQKPADEYRVVLIGDSSTWGFLLRPSETLSASLNQALVGSPALPDGRHIRVYNLGYPVMSLAKDLLILSRAMQYKPDLIIWLATLESFPYDKQLFPPLLAHNPEPVRHLIERYNLNLDPNAPDFIQPTFWDHTIIGDRRELADLVRLQAYGVLWAATGIDQDIPGTYTPRAEDLSDEQSFHDLNPPHLQVSDLAFDILQAGMQAADDVPVLLVNEPMFISHGKNSDIRYNFYYPRWAYDDYRSLLQAQCQVQNWRCLDLWSSIPPDEFTNSAVHLSPYGSRLLAELLTPEILKIAQ